jgi:predicted N-formylglutamate amidohydrolase
MRKPYEKIGDGQFGGPFVFSCEHATRHLPEWEADRDDLRFLEDHWGWDIGAADLTRALASETSCCAVLSNFSRLVCDPNREASQESFVVREIDGHELTFNRGVDDQERRRRAETYAEPYHAAIDQALHRRRTADSAYSLCSVHSFTPQYRGERRSVEVGVLFDAHEERARTLAGALGRQGFATEENVPYSGYEGLIYSARRHGTSHALPYLELEVRQDLIDTPAKARRVAARIAVALSEIAGINPLSGSSG